MEASSRDLAERIRDALESADLERIGALLHPDVHWGAPGGSSQDCTNRRQVLTWWGDSRAAGARASVVEVLVHDDRALVGLHVTGRPDPSGHGDGPFERWQVLSFRDGLVADIRGYESREEAAAAAGLPPGLQRPERPGHRTGR